MALRPLAIALDGLAPGADPAVVAVSGLADMDEAESPTAVVVFSMAASVGPRVKRPKLTNSRSPWAVSPTSRTRSASPLRGVRPLR